MYFRKALQHDFLMINETSSPPIAGESLRALSRSKLVYNGRTDFIN